jgi:hypothetical protein
MQSLSGREVGDGWTGLAASYTGFRMKILIASLIGAATLVPAMPAAAQAVSDVVVMRRAITAPAPNLGRTVEWKSIPGSCASTGVRNQDVQCVKAGTSTPATGCNQSIRPASTASDASCTAITCGTLVQGYWSTDPIHNGEYFEGSISGIAVAQSKCQAYARSVSKSGTCAFIGGGVNFYPGLGLMSLNGRNDVYAAVCQ